MKRAWNWMVIGMGLGAWSLAAQLCAEDNANLRDAVEWQARGGLPNVLARLRSPGESVRVGYLGGSITAAPGWRVKSLSWLQNRYPKAKLEEINAAIGGTGSDLGVFRVEQDVLRHQPDLMFVEFAVNDGGAAPERIQQAMEGIVRKTWQANPRTDICFVYTVSEPFLADLKRGKCSRSATAMEELADHYDIPSIHLALEAAQQVTAGELVFKAEKPADLLKKPWVFSTDGVHPHVETGHELYLQAIARSWAKLEASPGTPAPHPLVAPLRGDHWQAAKLIPLNQVRMEGSWAKLDPQSDGMAKRFANFLPELWLAKEPGASLKFRFRGRGVGIYDLVGPDCGQVKVELDAQAPALRPRFDSYCVYHRLSTAQIGSNLDASTVHEVCLTLDAGSLDKRTILFEKNRPEFDKNPDRFAPNHWYAGSVMLLGELEE